MLKKTRTSSFGVPGRVSHDSAPFYSRKLYVENNLPEPAPDDLEENKVPEEFIDRIILGDAREILRRLPDKCIHLMITSPPYNVGKEYDQDLTLGEYLDFIGDVMREVYRVLVWGGRVCFNVANLGRRPYIPLHAYLIHVFEKIGSLFRGEIIWDKGDARTCSMEEMLAEVEEFLVHLTVRGRSIDSYRFKFDEYIIFMHDPATLEPMWSKDQKIILETFGLLRQSVEVKASEGILRYVARNVGVNYKDAAQKFIDSIQIFRIKSTKGDAYE
jgi:hypothetical protein